MTVAQLLEVQREAHKMNPSPEIRDFMLQLERFSFGTEIAEPIPKNATAAVMVDGKVVLR